MLIDGPVFTLNQCKIPNSWLPLCQISISTHCGPSLPQPAQVGGGGWVVLVLVLQPLCAAVLEHRLSGLIRSQILGGCDQQGQGDAGGVTHPAVDLSDPAVGIRLSNSCCLLCSRRILLMRPKSNQGGVLTPQRLPDPTCMYKTC